MAPLLLVTLALGLVFTWSQFKGWGELTKSGNFLVSKVLDNKGVYGVDYTIRFEGEALIEENGKFFHPSDVERARPLNAELDEQKNTSSSYFFALTGAHLAHLVFGLLSLLVMVVMALMGRYTPQDHVGLWAGTVYWHFLGDERQDAREGSELQPEQEGGQTAGHESRHRGLAHAQGALHQRTALRALHQPVLAHLQHLVQGVGRAGEQGAGHRQPQDPRPRDLSRRHGEQIAQNGTEHHQRGQPKFEQHGHLTQLQERRCGRVCVGTGQGRKVAAKLPIGTDMRLPCRYDRAPRAPASRKPLWERAMRFTG